MAAIQEAIRISQEMNDPVCLQHALVCDECRVYIHLFTALFINLGFFIYGGASVGKLDEIDLMNVL